MTTKPRSETVRGCRKEASLGDTQEESRGEETAVALYNAHKRHDCTPGENDDGQPDGWSKPFKDDVGGDFEEGVGKEEDGQT